MTDLRLELLPSANLGKVGKIDMNNTPNSAMDAEKLRKLIIKGIAQSQMSRKRGDRFIVIMTSQSRTCLGVQFAKLGNKDCITCDNWECTRKLINGRHTKYKVSPVDTKWIDSNTAFEGEPMQTRSRLVAREFKSGGRPDLHAGTPPLEALKSNTENCCKPQGCILNYAHRCVSCLLPRKGTETSAREDAS